MPNYPLNALGSEEFEHLTQSLVKAVIGAGSVTFGVGPDGGREATFRGTAPYPSEASGWTGDWIFQAKFHDVELLGTEKARRAVIADVDTELAKITTKYKRSCDNYILITNVPLSSTADTGTHDRIAQAIVPKYSARVPNVHVWGYDDVCRLLEIHGHVRQAYLHFLTPGDVIAGLLAGMHQLPPLARTVKLYLATELSNERYAQLDQAGDVGGELPLAKVFVDLDVVPAAAKYKSKRDHPDSWTDLQDDEGRIPSMPLILGERLERAVFIGGPGQGKSTLGQFAAQVHRAALLGRLTEVIGDDANLTPLVPRIPFRMVLREFAQWISQQSRDRSSGTTIERYLAERVSRLAAQGTAVEPHQIQELLESEPVLVILDGLDEVVDPSLRSSVLREVSEFLERSTSVLHSEMQVICSSRPTGYAGEFNPDTFVHLELTKLSPSRSTEYVEKWLAARSLDEAREARVRDNYFESAHDPQIQLADYSLAS
jgi:hypothetical protein